MCSTVMVVMFVQSSRQAPCVLHVWVCRLTDTPDINSGAPQRRRQSVLILPQKSRIRSTLQNSNTLKPQCGQTSRPSQAPRSIIMSTIPTHVITFECGMLMSEELPECSHTEKCTWVCVASEAWCAFRFPWSCWASLSLSLRFEIR